MNKVLVINGPNLNMLGMRPKEHYGVLTLEQINNLILKENDNYFDIEFFQSNYEGAIITKIQESLETFAIIINPAGYTHTSVSIGDALEIYSGHKIEVHLSKVDERENYRKNNFVREKCEICFSGKYEQSYIEAINYLKNIK